MSRITDTKSLITGAQESAERGQVTSPGSDDFLGRIRGTVKELKELLQLVQEVRGAKGPEDPGAGQGQGNPPAGGITKQSLVNYLGAAIQHGYGDTTIEQLVKLTGPYNLRQVLEFLKRV